MWSNISSHLLILSSNGIDPPFLIAARIRFKFQGYDLPSTTFSLASLPSWPSNLSKYVDSTRVQKQISEGTLFIYRELPNCYEVLIGSEFV